MRLWIRTDGSRSIGLGHIKRSLTVAEEARRHALQVTFVISEGDGLGLPILLAANFPVSKVPPLSHDWLAELRKGDILLFDGYRLTDQMDAATQTRGIFVVAFDDHGEEFPPVDLLLMPSLAARPASQPRPPRALIGPRYTPVAPQFTAFRRHRQNTIRSLLVTLGSSDPSNLAAPVLRAIASLKVTWEVVLLLGPGMDDVGLPANPRFSAIRCSGDIAPLFDRFDAAVSAAGTTTWELLCMGMPTTLVVAAENQRGVVQTAVSNEAALYGGDIETIDKDLPRALLDLASPDCCERLSSAALELVDGKGAERIVKALLQ